MTSIATLAVNGQRLWDSLIEMATIGLTEKGGCNRQALTELDKQGRDLFIDWCQQVGCTIEVDQIGNIFARRQGTDDNLPVVITGSHLDTQPTGGKFDGVYGVLAGVEVLRTLNERNIQTTRSIEVVVWTNEEGARFPPACMGSGVWCGEFDLTQTYATKDKSGTSVSQALQQIGYKGERPAKPKAIAGAIELHIEQGPILEKQNKQIGIVSGIQGLRWFELTINGTPCHAGPTPMEDRFDPVMAALPIINHCYSLAQANGPWGRATIGDIQTLPGSPNTVPEQLKVSIDLRHPNNEVVKAMDSSLHEVAAHSCEQHQLNYSLKETWRMEVTEFDKHCVDTVQKATEYFDYPHMKMVSGAGHDSLYVSQVAPTAMIFIPCENGLSHNEAENVKPQDVTAGANVLLHTLLQLAGISQ